MSQKKRSRLADRAVHLAVRCLVCVMQMLGYAACLRLGDGLAWLAHRFDRRHRAVADENLRYAFPEMAEAARAELVRGVYRHFVGVAVTLVFLSRLMRPTTWRRYLEFEDAEALMGPMLSGRPVLFVTGHFGNWEMGGVALGLLGFRAASIARRLDNPYLHDFLLSLRGRHGQELLDKERDYEKMLATLASGGMLATLGDQDAGQRGLYVDFFGRPASTHKAMALMALEYRPAVVVMGIAKVGEPMRHRLYVEDVIWPEEYEARRDAVSALTRRMTEGLERLARRHPEQYFWLHRRWKHQPKARRAA